MFKLQKTRSTPAKGKPFGRFAKGGLVVFFSLLIFTNELYCQQPQTLLYDSNGKRITDNEFVDIRMANPNYPDKTIVKRLDDGTIEFRLQKIPQEGNQAPDVRFNLLDGRTVSLADLRGKVVVLMFWYIGCPVCRAMKPQLNAFRSRFKAEDDVVFIAVTADTKEQVKKYLAKESFDYLQAADGQDVISNFVVGVYPKNVVISKDGKIVYWRSVIKAWDKFEAVVREELAK